MTRQDHCGISDTRNLARLWKTLDHEYDRILFIEIDGLAGISPSAFRQGTKDMAIEELIGLLTSTTDWHVRSDALGAWVMHHRTGVWQGTDRYTPLLDAYRRNKLCALSGQWRAVLP